MSLPEMKLEMETKQRTNLFLDQNREKITYYQISKRFLDIIGSVIGIVIFIPLYIILAILMKIEDRKGSIFFKQTRVGKDGKVFEMYKFRSMVTNAEELLSSIIHLNETTGAMFKVKNDPRVTRLGRFIRKTSIDELPQLWNVLKGEMSLVGPRPPLPSEVRNYTSYDKQRLQVTPGCTGLWQVSGRSNIGFEEMVALDLRYIEKKSITYDVKLIFKTLGVMLGSRDAF